MTLLFIDTETGGISLDCSILTVTLTALRFGDTKIFPVDKLDLKVKPNDGIYRIQPGALKVNGIDLVEHDTTAITYKDASERITQFLIKLNTGESRRPTLCGQHVIFDLDHLLNSGVVDRDLWRKKVDPRYIDILCLAKFAMLSGDIPEGQSLKLIDLVHFFNIPVDASRLHTSDYDNELAAQVLFAFKKMFAMEALPIDEPDLQIS